MSKSIKTRSRSAATKSKFRSTANNSTALKKSTRKKLSHKKAHAEEPTQFVLPLGSGWVVKNGYEKGFIYITDSKREAIRVARTIAQLKGLRFEVENRYGKVEQSKKYRKPARTGIVG